jgi:hypothetical protein
MGADVLHLPPTLSTTRSGHLSCSQFFTGSLQAMNRPVTNFVYACRMGFFKIVPGARGLVSEMAFLPNPKVVGTDTNAGLSPHDWAAEWRNLAVMLWEVTGLQRGDPHFLRLTAPVMIPVGVAWHMEDWPAYQAACAHARRMIGRIPVEPRSTWWSGWETKGTA